MNYLLLFLSAFSISVLAATPQKVRLQVSVVRDGNSVCTTKVQMSDGQNYLVCEAQVSQKRIFVKMKTKVIAISEEQKLNGNKDQVRIEASIEEVNSEGQIKLISNPTVLTMEGEEGAISMGEQTPSGEIKEVLGLRATAEILR